MANEEESEERSKQASHDLSDWPQGRVCVCVCVCVCVRVKQRQIDTMNIMRASEMWSD